MASDERGVAADFHGTARAASRLPFWRVAHGVAILAAIVALVIALANVGFAMMAPFELEVREGTVWLHVLAQSAGVSLYDGARVAFVNMNHGPLDSVFKAAIHALFPGAPPYVVARSFVLLLPIALAALFAAATRRAVPTLALTAVSLCFLLGLGAEEFLIGRSDPTALALLCLLLWWAHRPFETATIRAMLTRFVGLGALAAAVALTNSRYALIVPAVSLGALLHFAGDRPVGPGRVALAALVAFGAALATAALVLATVFHGDGDLYYRHFVGFFTHESGWGTQGRMPFAFFPNELWSGRALLHIGILLLAVEAWRDWRDRGWSMTIAALAYAGSWWALAWAYSRNHGAAGLHYFAPLYIVVFYSATRQIRWDTKPRVVTAAFLLALAGLPWAGLWTQAAELRRAVVDGRTFAARLAAITGGVQPYSEDLHLFERRYDGRAVDMGDTVAAIARTRYFGADFSATVERQARQLNTAPPKFVLIAAESVVTPALRELLRSGHYELVATSPPLVVAERIPVRVYQLRFP